jgi:transcriptional regulator with XRE-family HTH domain
MQPSFGALLRRYRLAAGISQERLAERAGLSVQALSALENGRRQAPYRHTVAVLARALGLPPDEAAALESTVVRERVSALAQDSAPSALDRETPPAGDAGMAAPLRLLAPPTARTNLPAALSSFIGREREQGQVRALLDAARLVTLTGAALVGRYCERQQ